MQIEHVVKMRVWGKDATFETEQLAEEMERIQKLISEGFTSGEIIPWHGERGWWELETIEAEGQ